MRKCGRWWQVDVDMAGPHLSLAVRGSGFLLHMTFWFILPLFASLYCSTYWSCCFKVITRLAVFCILLNMTNQKGLFLSFFCPVFVHMVSKDELCHQHCKDQLIMQLKSPWERWWRIVGSKSPNWGSWQTFSASLTLNISNWSQLSLRHYIFSLHYYTWSTHNLKCHFSAFTGCWPR